MCGFMPPLPAILCDASLKRVVSPSPSFRLQVMRCIVEALADVLSGPRPLPVSQDCLLTLSSGRSPPTSQPGSLHSVDRFATLNAKKSAQERTACSIQRVGGGVLTYC